ncbi:hypothetical protein ACLFKQ_14460 [Myxosarcina sp. GI1(2024)]
MEIARAATVKRLQVQLSSEIVANRAEVARLVAQLSTETAERQANIALFCHFPIFHIRKRFSRETVSIHSAR